MTPKMKLQILPLVVLRAERSGALLGTPSEPPGSPQPPGQLGPAKLPGPPEPFPGPLGPFLRPLGLASIE